jgi:hypothetical protein
MASRTARACVRFETELVDELLGADELRVGGGVECVTAVIKLLAPDQLLGARRGVGVDRIERASVVARGGVRRASRPAPPAAARRRSSNLRRRLQRLAVNQLRSCCKSTTRRRGGTRCSSTAASASSSSSLSLLLSVVDRIRTRRQQHRPSIDHAACIASRRTNEIDEIDNDEQ